VGGRLEHTLGNLQLLDWLAIHGAQGFLAGEKTAATCLRDGKSISFPPSMAGYLSVFCNSGAAEGVTLSGLKYPLEDYTLTGDFPLGVSNQFLGVEASVSVERGSLLLIWEDKGGFYAKLPGLWAV
jgi:thiamine pyrophosphokinase